MNTLKIFLCLLMCIALSVSNFHPYSQKSDSYIQYWKVIMAEAVSEGYGGMYAVACVIRNRGGALKGFCGAKRKNLDQFCRKQGQKYIQLAKMIEQQVFQMNAEDITNGATHFENVEKFGKPYWAEHMIVTAKIGNHTFFKKSNS